MKRYLILSSILLFLLTDCQTMKSPIHPITPTPFVGNAKVELGDITMYFEAHGAGEPLILLHGGFGSADAWSNQVPMFSEQYYVVTPDSRAHDRTTDSDAPLSYHLMAEDIIRLMDYLGIESAYIVGWSDGGIMGIDLAIRHPERVKALVTFGATTSLEGNQQEFNNNIPSITVESLKSWLGNDYFDKMPDPERLPDIVEKVKAMWLTEPNFTAEELSAIKAPTLIMVGENDDVVRPDHALAIASAIPGAQALILPGMNHMGVIEMPDVWNKAVLDFLENK